MFRGPFLYLRMDIPFIWHTNSRIVSYENGEKVRAVYV